MSELAKINPQLLFKHKEESDDLTIRAISNDKSVCYFLDAPKEYFNFESDSFAVIDFNRVVSYYNQFNKPTDKPETTEIPNLSIEYNDSNEAINLYVKSSKYNTTLKHRLANEDVIIKPQFNKVKFPSIDSIVNLTDEQQANINNMLKLIGADRMKYNFVENQLILTLFNTKTSDTYETVYELEDSVEENFELITPSSGFALMPKGNYKIEVSSAGIMAFHLMREDAIDLTLYIAKEKKN
ncbi:MAG: hypothetical protein J6T10_27320 [Methanobrevibacter sp.]|nr:hypothetical protein [Methanobrevibacter sp.]